MNNKEENIDIQELATSWLFTPYEEFLPGDIRATIKDVKDNFNIYSPSGLKQAIQYICITFKLDLIRELKENRDLEKYILQV